MSLQQTLQRMDRARLVAVIRTKTGAQALAAARAVLEGGIDLVEITFTIPEPTAVLRELASWAGERAVVGAGTVLTPAQTREAIAAGARFVVSPIKALDLIPLCRASAVVSVIGGFTPTEIVEATRAGADMVKVFPINVLGGPLFIREILSPLPDLSLMVSGGVTLENVTEYLKLGVRTVALGSSITPASLVEAGRWEEITQRARSFVEMLAALPKDR